LKSGGLNLLKPYGPLQACNEIALPFTSGWVGKLFPLRIPYAVLEDYVYVLSLAELGVDHYVKSGNHCIQAY
jgi:hypothetical protein